tara:strand:- start:1166 stop:1387 length:222 start_codon:yes stop_codon:yes gene_type:complete
MNRENKNTIKEKRNIIQYINDVRDTEEKGIHPEYSDDRKKILLFWKKALKENKINQNDNVKNALNQIYKKNLS